MDNNFIVLETFWFDVAGFLGVSLYVTAYALLQARVIIGAGIVHTSMNGMAASFVLVSLIEDFNYYSAAIQIFFLTISIAGLYRYMRERRSLTAHASFKAHGIRDVGMEQSMAFTRQHGQQTARANS